MKQSIAMKGRKQSQEHIRNKAAANKGRKVWNKGIPRTEEWKKNHSQTMKGRTYPTITCPHCGKIGGTNNMPYWHFENCRILISR